MSDLWILAGQSNMEGAGKLTLIESPDDRVQLFAHGDVWRRAEEPLHWLVDANDPVHWGDEGETNLEQRRAELHAHRDSGAGCGLTFAKAIADKTGHLIDLLPAAHGGTSMQQWSPELKGMGGKSLYGALLRRTALALKTKSESKLTGMLWYQGESDGNPTDAALYEDRMIALIESFRSDLNSPDLPIYIAQLGSFSIPNSINPADANAWSTIREVQRTLPKKIANVHTAVAIDLDLDDFIHIGAKGHKRLGHRFANLVLKNTYGFNTPVGINVDHVERYDRSIRVSFNGVTGRVTTPDVQGRIPGFSTLFNGEHDPATFFKAVVDEEKPTDVLLYHEKELPSGTQLVYGYGFCSFCQAVDESDMAIPAFGPIDL